MAFQMPPITYEYDWNIMDPTADGYLPTYEPDEKAVRADLQRPLDQIKDLWNGDLKDQLEGFCNSFGGLKPAGAYAANTDYSYLDLVWYNGSSYVAIWKVDGDPPTYPTFRNKEPGTAEGAAYWQLFVTTLESGSSSSSVSAAGDSAQITATVTAPTGSQTGPSLVVALSGTGVMPLLSSALCTALGLQSTDNTMAHLLSCIPHIEVGTFTTSATVTLKSRLLFALLVGGSADGENKVYLGNGWKLFPASTSSLGQGNLGYKEFTLTNNGKTATFTDASGNTVTYIAVCAGIPVSST